MPGEDQALDYALTAVGSGSRRERQYQARAKAMSQTRSLDSGGNVYYTKKLNLNVTQLLLEYLNLEGVTKIFGIPGGAAVYLMDELRQQANRFDFVICRHETGAAYIAHGYAVVTDALAVVLTTSGTGATNAITGNERTGQRRADAGNHR
jgi:hypothetical protein